MAGCKIFILYLLLVACPFSLCLSLGKSENAAEVHETEQLVALKGVSRNFRCPSYFGRYPHPQSCEFFFECMYGHAALMHCNRGFLYDYPQARCIDWRYARCYGGNKGGRTTVAPPKVTTDHGRDVSRNFRCPAIYGRYPHPDNCDYFFECRFGYPTLMHCNQGYLYDERREQCIDKRRVKCHKGHREENDEDEIDVRNFKCPYIWGTFAHPYDCSKYFVCHYNVPQLYQCYSNDLYDVKLRRCIHWRKVDCGSRFDRERVKTSTKSPVTDGTRPDRTRTPDEVKTTATPEVTRPEVTWPPRDNKFHCPFLYGRYPDSKDCSRFYECRFAVPTLHQCPPSTLYDERREECRDASSVKCGTRPGGIDDDDKPEKVIEEHIRCPYVWGTFSHPEDCSKYIVCIYNVPTIFRCRKNELFHLYYRRCLPKEKVECQKRINPDDPGSRTTTTMPSSTTTVATKITSTTSETRKTTATPEPTTTTTTPEPTITTTKTPEPTTTSTTPEPTTTTTTTEPTTTTTTPEPTTTTTTPEPTTTTTPEPTTSTTTPEPTTATITTEPTTMTATPETTSTSVPSTTTSKPNTPPPTDCDEEDLDCILDKTGDVKGWFDCPRRFGHFPHGSSKQLFIHCDNWRPFVKKCADHTVFSPDYLVCMWEDKRNGI